MKCPTCNEQAITMGEWGRGRNAFSTQCAACGTSLKAAPSTWIAFGVTIVAAIGAWIGAESMFGDLGRTTSMLAMLPVLLLGGAVGFFVGGYRPAD